MAVTPSYWCAGPKLSVGLDDWGLINLNAEQRRDLLEILEDQYGSRATIITSQLPLNQWHDIIGDATLWQTP